MHLTPLRQTRVLRTAIAAALLALAPFAHAAERITLKNGSTFDNCVRHIADGTNLRLFFRAESARGDDPDANYLDVPAASVASVEIVPDPPAPLSSPPSLLSSRSAAEGPASSLAASITPTIAEIHQLLTTSGAAHHIDVDLLASLMHAESAGNVKAVSRTGARGLMQLMPGTAAQLGVKDAFVPGQNVEGGTKYLDELLTRYHDDIALALAAYNAGPGAVDRYHGVPPFRETRAYVSRIIREFNARKSTLVAAK
ncbi:lytic transglycosylase domain-containing protein [Granulicella tundricola]|uniref:Lytic transglycosylase catalytic n=1 Tax=Granulicella tundricola (strain ATCC BAA-1859 / DSM 23138 / MP5ACTX9) TaxID=1198114 RepID=E8WZN1_GRATM|nr:lytic transglycosylase domain-containing protein [Granulicella tundricola]ADW70005.1 Lytic transglycosylase catalytic [Granulicella tundricola MP5ACTX9]